jgi:drug/metabolite transporter (DMT)-like permease
MGAFFSVFLFMFKGRTATFAGVVNRLTSLVAGTTATVIFYLAFGGKFPKPEDWISLALILVAVWFLTRAEKKRTEELKASKYL